ncbi:MAG: ABC transporter permease [Dehalococcoidales bacterium]|nr:ABC transporter permease [Dehalococcoidales bacterium]
MTAYIIRRLIIGVIILLLVTMVVFLFVRLMPGDPLLVYMASFDIDRQTSISQENYQNLLHIWGLDRPIPVQYVDWLGKLFQGDLGKSITLQEDIGVLIVERMPRTAYIGFITFVLGTTGGIAAGIVCALRRGTWMDNLITTTANIGMTIPVFWFGILLMYFFAYKLGWLPTSGWTNPFDDFWMSTRQLIMPVASVVVGSIAGMARLTRSCMLEVMRADYVRTAWAKGLSERVIVIRHQLKNAMIPVVTALGGALGMILGGSVFIETVFAIPGMGLLMTNAVFDQDYQIVQAGVLLFGGIIIFSNLVVDILWGWLDPRIRLA